MLKIGDFSSLAQISIKTLRFYDETGLLAPARIDRETGYRYYSVEQLSRIHRILALKEFGLTLEQIRTLLDQGVTPEQMQGMLLIRQAEQEKRVDEELDRLNKLKSRIRLIEQENQMNYEVLLKTVPEQWIASVRETIPSYPDVGPMYGRVASGLGPVMANCPTGVAIWHDCEYKDKDIDAEAGFLLRSPVKAVNNDVRVHQLLETVVASVVHNGSYRRLPEAYDSVLRWINANEYTIDGPIREVYLQSGQPVRQDDETYVTEIQVPVKKSSLS